MFLTVLKYLGIGAVIVIIGFVVGFFYRKAVVDNKLNSAESTAKRIMDDAKKEASSLKKEAVADGKEEIANLKLRGEDDVKRLRLEIQKTENRLLARDESLDKKSFYLEKKEQSISSREKEIDEVKMKIDESKIKIDEVKMKLDETFKKEILRLEAIAELTREEARAVLSKKMEEDARLDAAKEIKKIELRIREDADKMAKKIISQAIQRCAIEHTSESTVSVVNLPNDEMKGRIIGREGRNIRVFENLTGINIIVDDTPEAVILSSFDPVRREIARVTLENLILDGRIHPTRIEEMFDKASKQVNNEIKVEGEQAVFDIGISEVNPGIIKVLGRLKYRTSYGQNVLLHSKEVAYVAGIIASELGLNIKKAKRAGLLHDIGKALTHDIEGSHAIIGAELARRLHEDDEICHAIESHHNEIEAQSFLDVIVQAADTISGSRPGARRETLESYVKRLETLEKIATEFAGIEKAFAIQAGREIRVMVKPDEINDEMSAIIARDIAKKIESEMEYPGQIKVTVIRESRAIDYAK